MPNLSLTRRGAHRVLAASLVTLSGVPGMASAAADPSTALADLASRYDAARWALFPLDATESTGDAKYEASFQVDIAPAHRKRQERLYRRTLAELDRIGAANVQGSDRITWDLLRYDATDKLALLQYPSWLMPVSIANSEPVRLAQWASGTGSQPLKTTANYRNFLRRLEVLPAWIAQATRNMDEGISRGIVMPRALVERVLPQLAMIDTPDVTASPYLAGLKAFPDTVPERDRTSLRAAYDKVVQRSVAPAVHRLHVYMRERYLPAARPTAGLAGLSGGRQWYRLVANSFTTTAADPAAIHELGLREVERIRGEMLAVRDRMGFRGSLDAFLVSVRDDPGYKPFHTDEDVLRAYAAINEHVKQKLPSLFERAPKANLEIRAIDPLRRDTASDQYSPPAADGSRPGVFYTVITDPKDYSTPSMTALFLHEGQPGHHYQMALQQEMTQLPAVRRNAWYDAFGEGWALYAEGLGREMGLYEQPITWLGRLSMELHRAVRLVVDTGLHDKGWSREQTMAYMRDMEGREEDSARRATERYMAWPGQALAYKTGELKLLELRERARQALGPRFDIRAFHTQVLGEGSMPLSMLQARIERWIDSQKG